MLTLAGSEAEAANRCAPIMTDMVPASSAALLVLAALATWPVAAAKRALPKLAADVVADNATAAAADTPTTVDAALPVLQ